MDEKDFQEGGVISGASSVSPDPGERVIPLRLLRELWEGRMTLAEVYEAACVPFPAVGAGQPKETP